MEGERSRFVCCWVGLSGVGEARGLASSALSGSTVTMSEQEVPPSIAQRVIIKFLAAEGAKPTEILRRLTAQFGEETLSRARVFAWHKQFVEGRDRVENESHDRRPRTSIKANNISSVRRLIEDDRRRTTSEIASEVGISYGSTYSILTEELGYRKVCARWVPRHDNARPHTAALTRENLEQLGWEVLEHPPYSPDLSPCDFHVFAPLKEALGGQRFDSDAEVEAYVRNWLQTRPASFYVEGIGKLPIRWEKCVSKSGEYVEK